MGDSDQYIGVTPRTAARVIGVTIDRLRRWRDNGLLLPDSSVDLGKTTYWDYNLEDLVQGRVIKVLEDRGIHVRHIKSRVDAYRDANHPKPLASLHWATDAGKLYVSFDGHWAGGEQPNQTVMVETINLNEVRADARKQALARNGTPGKFGTWRNSKRPVFDGTRIYVDELDEYFEAGDPPDVILADFPGLEIADIEAARAAN